MTDVLREAKELHKLGFAIIWLRPKEKRPVNSGWTTGPRTPWTKLEKTYREGMNVGVRLGSPSFVKGASFQTKGYLACIDVDVKDAKYTKIAHDKLDELVGKRELPTVLSGSGSGSQHLYCLTAKPFKQITVAKSLETYLDDEGRKHHKWEIVVYSDGRQMVLPPSIHPNGKPYAWHMDIGMIGLPLMDFSGIEAEQPGGKEVAQDFELSSVQLDQTTLPEKMKEFITDGKDCDDRSAGLLKAAISMVRHGLTQNEILTILTEKDTYLGKAAFDHAKTNSRKRAAQWLLKYTVKKAFREYDEAQHFEKVVTEEDNEPKLSHAEAVKQMEELTPQNFKAKIQRNEHGSPKNTLKNCVTILAGEFGRELFTLNEFSGFQLYGRNAPWGAKSGEEIKDTHIALITHWFANKYRFEPCADKINNAVTIIAENNAYHPVRQYLDSLEWDGKRRLDTWLKRHLSAKAPDGYLKTISRKVIIAMVARIYEPGIKFDQVLILEGTQGIGKSRAVRALASDEWFSDSPLNLMDKDGVLSLKATWIMELGELSGMRRADVDQLKDFISRKVDRIRVPYGKRMESFPRQCIFIGTTNNAEYLKDTTGNRRFWPVNVGECHIEKLKAERSQLLAEAKFAYELGEALWIEDGDVLEQATAEQEKRVETDAWSDILSDFFAKEQENFPTDKFTVANLFSDFGPFADTRMDRGAQMRAAHCLRQLGYVKRDLRGNDGLNRKYWISDEENQRRGPVHSTVTTSHHSKTR